MKTTDKDNNKDHDQTNNSEAVNSQTEQETLETENNNLQNGSTKSTSENEIKLLNETITRLESEKLRAMADFENFRKKTEERVSIQINQSIRSVLLSIVDVLDDFERMIEDLDQKDIEDDIDAFKPVLDKTKGILVDNGVEKLDIKPGDTFDPKTMEAIGIVSTDDQTKHNQIKHVAQGGYRYIQNKQMLRTAKVLVAKD